MSPKITVVMCAYNEAAFIEAAIQSILDQTYEDFELVIVDDASTDKTRDIICRFDDKRIVLVKNRRNLGLTRSLNIGLKTGRGSLIARMDANDIARNTRFSEQINVFESQRDIDLVWTGACYITRSGRYLCKKQTPPLRESIALLKQCRNDFPVGRNNINHITVMFQKDRVVKIGGYDERYAWGQDGNLWCRMLKNNAKFYFLEQDLMCIRLSLKGVTALRSNIASMDENDYYSSVAMRNCHFKNALRHGLKMPPGLRKIKRFVDIFRYLLVANIKGR